MPSDHCPPVGFAITRIFAVSLLLLGGFASLRAGSSTTTWTGNTSTEWSSAGNWLSTVPNASTDVYLDTNTGNQAVISIAPAFSNNVTVGLDNNSGANTSLTISSGANLTTSVFSVLGDGANATGGVTVTGNGSAWSTGSLGLVVGNLGHGVLTIANGGNLTADGTTMLGSANGSLGTLQVADANTTLDAQDLNIGINGTGNLVITNGAMAEAANVTLGVNASGNGTLVVVDPGSDFSASGNMAVGNLGVGNLIIANGATVEAASVTLGVDTTGNGTMIVVDQPTTLAINGSLTVGNLGAGTLVLANGGNIIAGDTALGNAASGAGDVMVGGANSTLNISGNFLVGNLGSGNLTISNHGQVTNTGFDDTTGIGTILAQAALATANVTVADSGVWTIGNLDAGYPTGGMIVAQNGNATLTISNGSIVNSLGWDNDGVSTYLAYEAGSNATVIVTGNNTFLNVGSESATYGALMVGRYGTANLTIANGGVVTVVGGDDPNSVGVYVGYGNTSNSSVTVTGPGSMLSLPDETFALVVGYNGTGNLTVTSGGMLYAGGLDCGCDDVAVYVGYLAGGNGTLLVTGTGSFFEIPDEAYGFYVGKEGTANFTIGNGAHASTLGFDADNAAVQIGHGLGSNGTALVTGPGSEWLIGSAGIFIGKEGNGTLTISNGGNITSGPAAVAFSPGGNGTVLVTGPGSVWHLPADSLYVGVGGFGNLTIANGGNVIDSLGYIGGYYQESQTGTGYVLVDGANSTWINNDVLSVGDGGPGNLTISNGGLVTSGNTDYLGNGAYVAFNGNGTVLVTDPGSTMNITHRLFVGWNAPGNLAIANGGTVINGDSAEVDNDSTATITGPGSQWLVDGPMSVGIFGNATLTISNGGNLSTTGGGLSDTVGAVNGTVLVTGTNSIWNSGADFLTVGDGGFGNLSITNGGQVLAAGLVTAGGASGGNGFITVATATLHADNGSFFVGMDSIGSLTVSAGGNVTTAVDGDIGVDASANGTVTVTGANSQWVIAGSLTVGDQGAGSLTVAHGGNVSSVGGGAIGYISGSSGNVMITDANSTWTVGQLSLGTYSTGCLTIANGGSVTGVGDVLIGDTSDGNGTAVVTGTGSSWDIGSSTFYVGYGGAGNLTIANGGNVAVGYTSVAYDAGSTGNVLVTGAGSQWHLGTLSLGTASTGYLTIANGGMVTESEDALIGDTAGGNGTALVTDGGSTWNIGSNILYVGYDGAGNLTIANGGNVTGGSGYFALDDGSTASVLVTGAGSILRISCDLNLAYYNSTAALTVADGGLVKAGTVGLGGDSLSLAAVYLNGTVGNRGILETHDITAYGGATTLTFNGGILKALSDSCDFLSGFGNEQVLLSTNGGFIDSNGHNVTINAPIAGGGGLTKQGAGIVTLTGVSDYHGQTVINAGALAIDGSLTNSAVHATGATATLAGNGTIPSAVVDNGAMISPGITNAVSGGQPASFSQLTIEGNLDWAGDGTTNFWHLNSGNFDDTGFAGNTSDMLVIQGNLTNIGSTGPITFDFENTGYFDYNDPNNRIYTLITVADNTFTDASFLFSQFYAVNVGPTANFVGTFQFGDSGHSLQFVIVPEPATWSLVLGAGALLIGMRRRRRR